MTEVELGKVGLVTTGVAGCDVVPLVFDVLLGLVVPLELAVVLEPLVPEEVVLLEAPLPVSWEPLSAVGSKPARLARLVSGASVVGVTLPLLDVEKPE